MRHCLWLLLVIVLGTALAGATPPGKTMGKEIGVPVHPVLQAPASALGGSELFIEGFNDTTITGFPPAGWLMINADGNDDPADTAWYQSLTTGGQGSLPPYEGAAFAADYYGTANGLYIDDYLITPNTGSPAPPGAVDSLSFWLTARRSTSGDYPDSLDIRVSTTGTAVGDFTVRLDYVLAPKANWTRFAYALPMADTRYIAFRYLIYDGGSNGSNSDKVCLDDVRITRYSSSAVREGDGIPAVYALGQNYPNPFNPTTQIRFTVPAAGRTTLKVHNLLGGEVAVLVDEVLAPGAYTTAFSGDGLPSGVYFYTLTSGSFRESRRMVLVR